MNKPIILDSFTGGNSPLNWISCAGIVLSIIAIVIVVAVMLIEDLLSKKFILWILIFSFTLILSVIGVKVSEEPGWEIYPNGMTLEEIETEYEVTGIDGLILTVYERK